MKVFSSSQRDWIDGQVDQICEQDSDLDGIFLPAGSVFVFYGQSGKWVTLNDIGSTLRKLDADAIRRQEQEEQRRKAAADEAIRLEALAKRQEAEAAERRAAEQAEAEQVRARPAPAASPASAQFTADTSSLGAFARGLRQAQQEKNLTLVAGSETADADSIVAAFAYAFLKQACAAPADGPVVTIVACSREDLTARRGEVNSLLSLCGVSAGDLMCIGDPGVDAMLRRVKAVTLVDHNKATGPLASVGIRVVEMLDHHEDLKAHPRARGEARRIAFEAGTGPTAGSCCTLVAEAFLATSKGRELLARDSGATARALAAVILLDTERLDPAAGKVCPCDAAAVAELQQLVGEEPQPQEVFDTLRAVQLVSGNLAG